MRKILSFFTLFTLFILLLFSFSLAFAQEENQEDQGQNQDQQEQNNSEQTFPAQEAGIAAYVKLDVPSDQMYKVLTDALNYYSSQEEPRVDRNYVIGVVEIENETNYSHWKEYPHLYIGLDGWMVAYYLKDESPAHIMQWKGYTPGVISSTTLEDAINYMCEQLNISYNEGIKYYDFAYPEATQMTIVAESVSRGKSYEENNFSVMIPGTIYQASYTAFMHCGYASCTMKLELDGHVILSDSGESKNFLEYGDYPLDILSPDTPHLISFGAGYWGGKEASIFIYGD